jgi:hypothetical protein
MAKVTDKPIQFRMLKGARPRFGLWWRRLTGFSSALCEKKVEQQEHLDIKQAMQRR